MTGTELKGYVDKAIHINKQELRKRGILQPKITLMAIGLAFGKPEKAAKQYVMSLYNQAEVLGSVENKIKGVIQKIETEIANIPLNNDTPPGDKYSINSLVHINNPSEKYIFNMGNAFGVATAGLIIRDEAMHISYTPGVFLALVENQDGFIADGYPYGKNTNK
jgi:hypothetical protein